MKNKVLLITIMLSVSMIAGCQRADVQKETEQIEIEEAPEEVEPEETQPEETKQEETEQESFSSQEFSFADVADRQFYFSSGVGGWYTVLYIHEDGTFEGHYQDSDMGVADAEYPNGTIYYSDFYGSFTEPEKIDDTTYSFQIASIEYPYGFGEEIKDGYYYYYSTAYGLDGAEELYMYLPGTKLADLPEAYLRWIGYYDLDSVSETELPFYGLYNVKQEEGFSGYSYEKHDAPAQVEEEISKTEEKVAGLQEDLQNAQTQADMNVISGEIYEAWDDTLNVIWEILQENLDEDTMKQLSVEEHNWIAEKEAAIEEAGAEYEGGSISALVVNNKAAELTKERVYELAGYLN